MLYGIIVFILEGLCNDGRCFQTSKLDMVFYPRALLKYVWSLGYCKVHSDIPWVICPIYYVMLKVQVWTIWAFSCTNKAMCKNSDIADVNLRW